MQNNAIFILKIDNYANLTYVYTNPVYVYNQSAIVDHFIFKSVLPVDIFWPFPIEKLVFHASTNSRYPIIQPRKIEDSA